MAKEKAHYIYKIHFLCGYPTGRYYIGKHTGYIDDTYGGSGKFCKAYYNKYGKVKGETYIREILEINPSKEINRDREKMVVGDLWRTDPLCMNQMPGGWGLLPGGDSPHKGKHLSEEAKEKIRIKLKGRKRTKTAIEKSRLGRIGLKHSEKTKQLLSKRFREIKRHPIYQLDDNGNILNIFDSTHDVERKLGYAHQNIVSCCSGKHEKAYGYKWIYEEDYKCQQQLD